MTQITLAEPWTYRTPAITVTYPAGTHEVAPDIAAAAPVTETETEEADDGNRTAKASAPRRSRKAES